MKSPRLFSFFSNMKNNQRGFTLIELIIAVAITALITGGITTALYQVYNVNTLNTNHMTATRQVQNAGFWISQDSQMAQIVVTADDAGTAETEFLILSWSGWDYEIDGDTGIDYVEVRYSYDAATSEVWRSEAITTTVYDSRGQFVETINSSSLFRVAQFITNVEPLLSPKTGVTITAEVADATEQRTYEVLPRPIG
jgi:prepilin-type N-terminal cleavage/methylation domain-containing protein